MGGFVFIFGFVDNFGHLEFVDNMLGEVGNCPQTSNVQKYKYRYKCKEKAARLGRPCAATAA
jgi:hypothetical protein